MDGIMLGPSKGKKKGMQTSPHIAKYKVIFVYPTGKLMV